MKLNTAFLLGAGFSCPAGVPIMRDLAAEFAQILQGAERDTYLGMKESIPEIEDDFELLMECAHDLSEVPVYLVDRLARRCFGEEFHDLVDLAMGAARLEERLKGYLRERCVIQNDRSEYLYPLMQWLKKTGYRLDIFTLNYDLLVEGLCEEFFLPYTDGFWPDWQPALFGDPQFQIDLYKLHGSFIWYQSPLGERMKLSVPAGPRAVEYLAEDGMVSMMVYPRRRKSEPFSDLWRRFRERLLTLDRLVVIGYSFRDEELLRSVKDGLRKNRKLCLDLVQPGADQVGERLGEDARVRCLCEGVEEWIEKERYLELLSERGMKI